MKVVIIGAGPAGIYLTLFLRDLVGEVLLFDQNKRIGEKLRITGGGRMNVTNRLFTKDQFTSESTRPLDHLFRARWVENRYDLFAELGVEYVWEGNRAILKSGDAVEEVERLNKIIVQQPNAQLQLNSKVTDITPKGDGFTVSYEQDGKKSANFFDRVVLAGGAMFRLFDLVAPEKIYQLPLSAGHQINDLSASLSPLRVENHSLRELSGIAFVGRLFDPANQAECTSDILITHAGISGPACLDFSALKVSADIEMSFLPQVAEEKFSADFSALRQGRNTLRKFLLEWLPKRLVDWHLQAVGLDVTTAIADISKDTEKNLRKNLFHFLLKGTEKFDYRSCWTTKGGVKLDEVNVGTLESKIQPHLYFAGEILDVNGLCGGYNISFAAISAKIVSEALMKVRNEK